MFRPDSTFVASATNLLIEILRLDAAYDDDPIACTIVFGEPSLGCLDQPYVVHYGPTLDDRLDPFACAPFSSVPCEIAWGVGVHAAESLPDGF